MRSTARQPRDDPAPEPAKADLDAKAVRVLDEHLAASAGIQALMARCPDPQSAALLRHALVLIADAGTHAEELRAQMKAYGQANESLEVAFQAGRDYERKLQAAPPVLRQGHRAPGKWTQNPILRSIKVVAFGALAWSGLRYAFRAHRIAAALTAVTLPVAVGAGTYVALQPGTASSLPAASAPNPAASIYAATPAPSTSLAGSVRHAKKAAKGGGRRLLNGSGVPVSWISTNSPQQSSSSSSSSSAPSVQASVSVGPATLTVSAASLDLSNPLDPTTTFSITASGGGWASWRIGTAGTDLEFSPSSGVLQAGGSVTVTVSLAPSLDNLTQQTFSVAGQQVTVALPLPVPVPSVSPVVSASGIPSLP